MLEGNQSNSRYSFVVSLYPSFIASIFFFLAVLLPVLFNRFRDRNNEAVFQIETQAQESFDSLLQNIDAFPLTASLVTLLLWMLVGVVVYFLSNYILKLIAELKDDVEVSVFYVHPRHFKQSRFWLYVVLEVLYTIATIVGLIIWILFSFMVILPFGRTVLLLASAPSTTLLTALVLGIGVFISYLVGVVGFQLLFRLFRSRINY